MKPSKWWNVCQRSNEPPPKLRRHALAALSIATINGLSGRRSQKESMKTGYLAYTIDTSCLPTACVPIHSLTYRHTVPTYCTNLPLPTYQASMMTAPIPIPQDALFPTWSTLREAINNWSLLPPSFHHAPHKSWLLLAWCFRMVYAYISPTGEDEIQIKILHLKHPCVSAGHSTEEVCST